MATKQYQYTPETGDNTISEVGTDDIVLYVDDINKEVVAKVVELHNEGKSIQDIQKILDKDERVTLDEADFIVEQLTAYEKLSEGSGTQYHVGIDPIKADTVAMGSVIYIKTPAEQLPITEAKPQTRGEKAAATRKANSTGKVKSATPGTKAIDAKSLVALMKEKIELVEYVAAIEIPEIATPANKDAREIVIALQKAIEQAKNSAIVAIQEL